MDALLNWLWQGVVVAGVLFVVLRLLEHARANIRYLVCGVALLIVLAIPALSWLSSLSSAPFPIASVAMVPPVQVPHSPWTSAMSLLALWSVWAVTQSLRLWLALVSVRRARRTSRAFPDDVECRLRHWMRIGDERRRARLVVSEDVGSAAVLGCGAPMIAVAPALVGRLSPDELDAVVIHEWAHVQRRDDLAGLLQLAVRVIAGWHPAVWWIERRLQVEREVACDETTVAVTGSAKSYATCLVRLADLSAARRVSLAAPGVLTAGDLRHRVTKIVSGRAFASATRSRCLAVAGVVALVALTGGIARLALFTPVVTAAAGPATVARTTKRTLPREIPVDAAPVRQASPPETTARDRTVAAEPSRVIQTSATDVVPVEAPSSPVVAPAGEEGAPPQAPAAGVADAVPVEAAPVDIDAPQPVAAVPEPTGTLSSSDSRSPWVAAGGVGTAIGRGSMTAGVATAGFFTRFARRVAGSF